MPIQPYLPSIRHAVRNLNVHNSSAFPFALEPFRGLDTSEIRCPPFLEMLGDMIQIPR